MNLIKAIMRASAFIFDCFINVQMDEPFFFYSSHKFFEINLESPRDRLTEDEKKNETKIIKSNQIV